MADYWIKWYHEIIDDPKMATLPDRLWRRFSELCLIGGRLCADKSGNLPNTAQLAWMLRMPIDELQIDMDQLAGVGLITSIPNGWFIVNFQKRQQPISSTERVRRHRERKQKEQYYNNDETQLKRNVTQINREQINRLTDTEGEDQDGSPLTEAFVKATNILPHDLEKWTGADQDMTRAGVLPVDIELAVKKMDQDGLTYSGLWSVSKVAMWVKSRREKHQPIFTDVPAKNGKRSLIQGV